MELVVTDMAPEKGAGVVPIVYMTSFPPFGRGVHSMVTSDCPIPWMVGMESLRCTLLGGSAIILKHKHDVIQPAVAKCLGWSCRDAHL